MKGGQVQFVATMIIVIVWSYDQLLQIEESTMADTREDNWGQS